MESITAKSELENKILSQYKEISDFSDKTCIEFMKLLQKIYTPIWNWMFYCFNEDDIRNAGIEIFHCIKRCILKYDENENHSFLGFLYSCLETEIKHKKKRGELSPIRMCSRDDYNKAIKLIKAAEKIGKNPSNENVQIWLAKQTDWVLEQVKELIVKYHQSQIIEETSFESSDIQNPYPLPEMQLITIENVKYDLEKIDKEFSSCQTRQKVYLSSFITLRVIHALETRFEIKEITELLKSQSFTDLSLLECLLNKAEFPSQKELALKLGKDEGYVSNRIKEFFEKVQRKISIG
ncbi:MAG: hypothetical protein J6I73_02840 [Treponema sp.]|nr:hypothetical protein [Treponema sp.]